MDDERDIEALRGLIRAVPRQPDVWVRASEHSGHVGAVLADTCLQAGLNYETVVVPRVKRFLAAYPEASTVSALRALLQTKEPAELLGLQNERKGKTFRALTALLEAEGVESADELRTWLANAATREKLLAVFGVGIKSAAYLRLLMGLPSIAIDVHLRRAAEGVGVRRSDDDLERLFTDAAAREGVPLSVLDGSLWQDGSDKANRRRAT